MANHRKSQDAKENVISSKKIKANQEDPRHSISLEARTRGPEGFPEAEEPSVHNGHPVRLVRPIAKNKP